ncbi:MAG: hypothetical protein ABIR81_02415 [Ginsengibacter sp.]
MNGYSLKTIFVAWLITGTMDMSVACLNYYNNTGKSIDNVFKFIASGLTGQAAFAGGHGTSLLGIVLHYTIALFFVLFYVFVFCRITELTGSRFMTGFLYGLFIWATMSFIVLPLSATPKAPFQLQNQVVAATILIACIGLPLALFLYPATKANHSFS